MGRGLAQPVAHDQPGWSSMFALLKKYRWYLVVSVLVYAAVSLWLFFATENPQNVPFEYQVF